MTILQRGDQVPRGDLTTLDGETFSYPSIWQRRNLVLVAVPESSGDAPLFPELAARARDFDAQNSTCVVTSDRVPGLAAPGVLVADRWGEIVHVARASRVAELPSATDLLEWLEFIQRRCAG